MSSVIEVSSSQADSRLLENEETSRDDDIRFVQELRSVFQKGLVLTDKMEVVSGPLKNLTRYIIIQAVEGITNHCSKLVSWNHQIQPIPII
jgi:hypothetical protein